MIKLEGKEKLIIQGPSGCGKTTLAKKILRGEEEVYLDGELLSPCDIAYIPQDPGAALNPLYKVRTLLREVSCTHSIPNSWLEKRPHELSGGMQQQLVAAIAKSLNRRLLLADEPTANLDTEAEEAFFASITTPMICITHKPLMLEGARCLNFVE